MRLLWWLSAITLAGVAGCDGESDPCVVGTAGCPCGQESTCVATEESGPLTCDRGWCVPRTCEPGAEGCRCYPNGTCDPLDGTPMTCANGLCGATTEPEPGTLNGTCDASTPCGDFETEPLECVRGRCELPTCPSGALGCPCGSYGLCDAYRGRQPMCTEGWCALSECAPGEDGCACDGDSCTDDATTCLRGVCMVEPGWRVTVTGDVRACEVLLDVGDAASYEAVFDPMILGHDRRRGSRVALAFTRRSDTPFDRSPVRVELTPRATTTPGEEPTARILSATCFDRLGHRADGAFVSLDVP